LALETGDMDELELRRSVAEILDTLPGRVDRGSGSWKVSLHLTPRRDFH